MTDNKEKKLIRRKILALREAVGREELEKHSLLIVKKFLAMPEYLSSKVVSSYSPINFEADISEFNKTAVKEGRICAYPVTLDDGKLIFAVPKDENAWHEGPFGIKTPLLERSLEVPPSEIDFAVVPCVGFDPETGVRLGMGGGYYDRIMPEMTHAFKVSPAFEFAKVENLTACEHDMPVDAVVTEKTIYRFKRIKDKG
ncbi:MAG: 5-formyltetrahydrofolate cyclo-ligase [Ruminococcaceae bacterium]|nr:5-formyltetrahydrofolate cyclo-ligase [Oscillospiraceae bacterium]